MKDIDDFKRKGPSIWSFLFIGAIGAVIGVLLTLSLAPAYMYEGLSSRDDSIDTAYTPGGNDDTDECLIYAARSIKPSLVAVAAVKKENSEIKVLSSCTGIVIDSAGYILTGYFSSTKDVYVYLQDDSNFPGEVVWSDKSMDISILKVDKTGLIPATLGDSEKQNVGQMAATAEAVLGYSLEFRLGSGIISGIDRTLMTDNKECLQNLLQSQASSGSIEPEGTPLINSSGEVIGINISKASNVKEDGFAIPINLLKPIIYSISQNGEAKEPDIGIEGVDSELAKQYHIEVKSGIYIKEIIPGGEAELASLSEGDIILSVSSNPVNTMARFREELYKVGVGNIANLKIKYKDGSVGNLRIILEEKDKE